MESFYGGRQGASFVIVKRFDGIDIPSNTVHRNKMLAYVRVNNEDFLLVDNSGNVIEKSRYNFTNSYKYKAVPMNGQISKTRYADVNGYPAGPDYVAGIEYAEGMIQCFSEGGRTTSDVNYGEYVLIDTCENMCQQNNPDNGKVFRRGLEFQNDLGGAEYIGQIVGPQGSNADIDIDHYEKVVSAGGTENDYDVYNKDLVPGKEYDNNGNVSWNDTIKYSYVNIKDDTGTIVTYTVGFRFPYYVQEMFGKVISPYEKSTYDIADGTRTYSNLITRTDDRTHPFFQEWSIDIPHGIKGDSFTDLEIVGAEPRSGSNIYNTEGELAGITVYTKVTKTGNKRKVEYFDQDDNKLSVVVDMYAEDAGTGKWRKITIDGTEYRIKNKDLDRRNLRYKYTVYDRAEGGDFRYIDLGPYNDISKVTLTEQGLLTVYYGYDDPDTYQLKWIDKTKIENDKVYFYDCSVVGDNIKPENAMASGWLNMIKEYVVSIPQNGYSVPAYHLLCRYTDPDKVAEMVAQGSSQYTYPSSFGGDANDWIDLGDIRGESGGIHIIRDFADLASFQAAVGNNPPEVVEGRNEYAGWSYTVDIGGKKEIYYHDYNSHIWYSIGSIDSSMINPNLIIRKTAPVPGTQLPPSTDIATLRELGFWLSSESATFAQ